MDWLHWFTNGHTGRLYDGARPFIRPQTRLRIWIRDLGQCRYCDWRGMWWQMELDHVRPWSRRGRNWRNLVVSCPDCNGRKSNKNGWKPRPLATWQHWLDWALIVALWDWPRPEDL